MSAASLEAMAATRILRLRHDARRAGRIGLRYRPQAELAQRGAALAERLRVAQHLLHGGERRAGRHQLVAHAQEMLADDVEVGAQQVMDIGDAAATEFSIGIMA